MYNTQKISFERKQCIVKSCNRKNARKFSLPSDTEGAKLWLELLDRKDLTNHRNTSNLRVCEAHFAPHMMTASGKRLVQWAIPHKVTENETASTSEDVTSSDGQNLNEITTNATTVTATGTTIVVPAIIKASKQKKIEIKKFCEKITASVPTTAITPTTSATATSTAAAAAVASTITVKTTPITTNTISSIKPQIINLNQIKLNRNEYIKNNGNNRNHQQIRRNNVAEVLNFEIKDDTKSVIEKATTSIMKDDINLHKNGMQTVIETLKVDTPQIITINPATISTKTIQTIPTIQNNKTTTTTTATKSTTMPIVTTPLKTTPKTLVITKQNLNNVTAASASTTKKRKLIIHNHNKNKIRKSDLINLAQQAINEAKNTPTKDEDQFDLIGKRIAIDLRHMDQRQKAIAEKLVNDVIYYGKIGQLRETSSFNPFYSSTPTPVISTTPTVIQTAVQSSSSQHQQQQQQQQQQHNNNNHQQAHQNHQPPQQTHQTRQIQTATVATPIVAGSTSSQTIAIPPVGSLITATPIVSTVQVAGTNQIIYTVSNQNANASTITLNGQTEQTATNGASGQSDKCQWWPARNIAYM